MENIKISLAGSDIIFILAAKTFGNVSFKAYRKSIQLVL